MVSRLSEALTKAVNSPQVRARLDGAGFEFVGSTPAAFAEELSGSVATYRKIVTQAGIKPE